MTTFIGEEFSDSINDSHVVKSRTDIFELAQHNPIVNSCITHYELGDLTWEVAMMSAVKFLAMQNQNMFQSLVKYHQKYGAE